jgi:hypothetical protein
LKIFNCSISKCCGIFPTYSLFITRKNILQNFFNCFVHCKTHHLNVTNIHLFNRNLNRKHFSEKPSFHTLIHIFKSIS